MARGGSDKESEQPSLFGDELPRVARKKERKPRVINPAPVPSVLTLQKPDRLPLLLRIRGWATKVIAEAAHKLAVRSAQVFICGILVVIVLSFFAFLQFDPREKLEPYWRYVDMIEKGIFAKRAHSAPPSKVDTGGVPPPAQRPPPSPPPPPEPAPAPKPDPSTPPSWTVDVFPERD